VFNIIEIVDLCIMNMINKIMMNWGKFLNNNGKGNTKYIEINF